MQVFDGAMTQGFQQLLACSVCLGVVGEVLTIRAFCWVAGQPIGGGAQVNWRVRPKFHIMSDAGLVSVEGRFWYVGRLGTRRRGPLRWVLRGRGVEDERRRLAGPWVDWDFEGRGAVGGVGEGSDDEGSVA